MSVTEESTTTEPAAYVPSNPLNTTVAELVIDDLALGESELRARVADLEADVVAYRELTQTSIAALADLTKTHERMRTSYYQLLDERRAARRIEDRAA